MDAQVADAQDHPDADALISRLDELSRARLFMATEIQTAATLVAAELLERRGNVAGALAAYGRRVYAATGDTQALSTFLREESRLAHATGDRERALRATRLYLNLRSDPEPAEQADVDPMEARLRELVGQGPG